MARKPKRNAQCDAEMRAALRSISSAERAQAAKAAKVAAVKAAAVTSLSNHCKGKPTWTIYLHPEAKNALDELAHTLARKKNDLGEEAVNLLLAKYGMRPIA